MLSNFNQATRFDEFMRFALYDPQYGYYARGEQIFGAIFFLADLNPNQP